MENQIAFLFPMEKFGAAIRLNVNAEKGKNRERRKERREKGGGEKGGERERER
jgi:hypothetical protein